MRLSFRIAMRFLFSSKGQTLLILLGIAIGISVQIFIGSLIQGLQESLLDATIGSSPHITISASEKNTPVNESQSILEQIEDNDKIIALSESISLGAFLNADDRSEQILLRGLDFMKADEIYGIQAQLLDTSSLPESSDQVLIGKGVAEEFKLALGDKFEILTVTGMSKTATISGIFDFKVAAINNSWVLSDQKFARSLGGYSDDQVTEIEMQILEPFDADLLAVDFLLVLNQENLKIEDWKTQNEQLLSGLNGQSTSSLMIQVFVVISVVLAIASVLAISVMQKSRQLGILKAMGINDAMASYIFLAQGLILGFLGGLLGIVFGLGLLFVFTTFALNPDGTPVVPILINPGFIVLSGMIAMTASTLASMIPALKSKKLSPMEVIKNG